MWKTLDELATDTRLKALMIGPVLAACYDSAEARALGRRECTPNTRKQVLRDLSYWRYDKKKGNIYWLNGMAGTGKTTIASSLCAILDQSHELGASFFCSRLLPHCRDIKLILPAIAYQLACYSYPFRSALSLALQQEPNLHSKSLPKQLEGLIIKPLRSVARALPTDVVVVIDALDECEDSQGVSLFIEVLVKSASDLPIKVLVSSRPEPQIRQKIGDTKSQLILHELEDSIVREDIKLYLRSELRGLVPPISEADLVVLADRADVLFIYAATVVRFFTSSVSVVMQRRRVQSVLETHGSGHPSPNKAIDMLYDTILASAFNNFDLQDNEKAIMRLVLNTVVCAQEPLTIAAIAGLLELEDKAFVQAVLEPLWSVLHISGGHGTVNTLHASFSEYVLDPTRSREYGCIARKHHNQLANLCFNRIKNNKPQFNICGLESSFVLDDQVPNLEERVTEAIPQELMYACLYWISHLELGEPSAECLQQLRELLLERLLLWVEILNLKKSARVAISIMSKVDIWCKANNAPRVVEALVHEAWRFVTAFATSSPSRSTPHLYTSMLASWENTGLLAGNYTHRTKGLVRIEGTGLARGQPALLNCFFASGSSVAPGSQELYRHVIEPLLPYAHEYLWLLSGSRIFSIAFSPTGTRVAFCSNDKMIRVWDTVTGRPAMDPIEGHTEPVNSLAFSSDGSRIVSGSSDQTIRIWDATSGTPIMDPIKDGAGEVNVVAFSPNGKWIVSGSAGAIRVWDATSGMPITDPIVGHTDVVTAAAFSPDSMCIVSGSRDKTICVWDAASGNPLTPPLVGHTNWVNSVAFSPDGRRIVSGSSDRTIRVWDVTTRKLALNPIEGHTGRVRSVTFSANGTRIASGAADGTVRVWDATSGKNLFCMFQGQTSSVVISVAFSHNDGYIISGSSGVDSTICVWDSTGWESSPETTSHWADLILLFAARSRILRVVKDTATFLYSSTSPRQMPEVVDEWTAPCVSLSPLLNGSHNRHESRWGLTRDILEALMNLQTIQELKMATPSFGCLLLIFLVLGATSNSRLALWFYPLYAFANTHFCLCPQPDSCGWAQSYSTLGVSFSLRLVMASLRPPRGLLAYAWNCDWSSRAKLLLAFGQLCVLIALGCMIVIRELLVIAVASIDSQLNNWAMWVQDTVRIAGFAQASKACLWLLVVLLRIIYGFGSVGEDLYSFGFVFAMGVIQHTKMKGENFLQSPIVTAFSFDGTRTASGYSKGHIHIQGVPNRSLGKCPFEGHTDSVQSIAFSSDATRIVSGSRDMTIRVWNTTSARSMIDPITGHTGSVDSVAFSPDDMRIVSGSGSDCTIRVWDATSGRSVMEPITSNTPVNSVAFSPDGTRIVSHSTDRTIRVWNATSGKQMMQLCTQHIPPVHTVAFLSDSERIATFSDEGTVRLWDTRMPKVKHNLWTLNDEGWVVDYEGRLLLWLPFKLRPHLLPSRNLYSIPAREFVALNFDGSNIGESWAECYVCA